MSYEKIAEVLEDQAEKMQKFVANQKADVADLRDRLDRAEAKANRPNFGGASEGSPTDRKALNQAVRALLAGDQQKANAFFIEAKAMSATVGTDPSGGYVVHPDFSDTMTRVLAEVSPIYRLARVVDVDGDSFEEVIDRDAAGADWVGETTVRPDTSTPNIGVFRCQLYEISAQPKASQKLLDTASIDILAWLRGKIVDAFGAKESAAFHSGDGLGKPLGFLAGPVSTAADATRAWGTVQYLPTGASGAFLTPSTSVSPADVLVDLVGQLKAQYRTGAVWLMNRTTAALVRKLKDADGRHVWVDSLLLGQPSVLLGYPVEISEDMPDVAAGSLSIVFGNFKRAFTIIQKPGVKFLTDPYTDKPYVRLYAYRRIGFGTNNSEALKFLKFSTT